MLLNKNNFTDIIGFVAKDFHPPFYASLLKISTLIFGSSLFVARMVSLLAIVLTVWLIFYPIRKLFGTKSAMVMMILYLTTNVVFYSSIEIRNYSWSPFFLLAACTYLLTWIKDKKNKSFILYIISSILAMYTHYYSMMAIVFMNIVFLIHFIFKKRDYVVKFLIAHLIEFISFIPWYFVLKAQIEQLDKGFWISKPKLSVIYDTIKYIFNSELFYLIIIAFGLIYGIVELFKRKEKKKLISIVLVFLSIAVTIYMFYIYSLTHTSIFLPRYLGILSGLLFLVVAIIIGSIKNKYIYGLMIGIIILPFFILYPKEYTMTNDDSVYELKDKIVDSVNTYFVHVNEWDLGIFTYYFPNSKHIFVLGQNTVLNNGYKVFGDNVIVISNIEELNNISDNYIAVNLKYNKRLKIFFKRYDWDSSIFYEYKNDYSTNFTFYNVKK